MTALTILAGGRGTRLFGTDGGCKPLIRVTDTVRLIDYLLTEVRHCNLHEIALVVPSGDCAIGPHVQSVLRESVSVHHAEPTGTGDAVRTLLAATSEDTIIVATCDIFGNPGELSTFIRESISIVESHPSTTEPICVIATSPVPPEDNQPIFVHTTDGLVTRYGKAVPRSDMSFASVRVMNRNFATAMLSSSAALTDTSMMASVLARYPGSIRANGTPSLFDVDDGEGLKRAVTIASALRQHQPNPD